jgi:hypothetical protein
MLLPPALGPYGALAESAICTRTCRGSTPISSAATSTSEEYTPEMSTAPRVTTTVPAGSTRQVAAHGSTRGIHPAMASPVLPPGS